MSAILIRFLFGPLAFVLFIQILYNNPLTSWFVLKDYNQHLWSFIQNPSINEIKYPFNGWRHAKSMLCGIFLTDH